MRAPSEKVRVVLPPMAAHGPGGANGRGRDVGFVTALVAKVDVDADMVHAGGQRN